MLRGPFRYLIWCLMILFDVLMICLFQELFRHLLLTARSEEQVNVTAYVGFSLDKISFVSSHLALTQFVFLCNCLLNF
jgi:hypothetical protein